MALDETLVDHLHPLFAVRPDEFVAARNTAVKALKKAKAAGPAALVAAVRRPTWVDWALNAAAETDADALSVFTSAAADGREAQAASIEGRSGPDLRSAMAATRDATRALTKIADAHLVAAGRAAETAEIAARLGAVAASADLSDQLAAGVLGAAEPDDTDLFAGLHPRPSAGRRKRPEAKAKRGDTPERDPAAGDTSRRAPSVAPSAGDTSGRASSVAAAEERAKRDAERFARRRAEARKPLAAAVERAEALVAESEHHRDEARAALAEARAAVAEAEAALASAQETFEAAATEHETAADRHERAHDQAEHATEALREFDADTPP